MSSEHRPSAVLDIVWYEVPYVFALGLQVWLQEATAPRPQQAYRELGGKIYRARHRAIRAPGVFILLLVLLVVLVQYLLAPALCLISPSPAESRWGSLAVAVLCVGLMLFRLLRRGLRGMNSIYARGLRELAERRGFSPPSRS